MPNLLLKPAPTHRKYLNVTAKMALITLLVLSFLLASCNLLTAAPTTVQGEQVQASQPETLITFRVTLPASLRPGESVSLAVLDEVTGLAFNQVLYPLQAEDALHYSATLKFTLGSVLKYRYLRQGDYTVQEHLPNGEPVRYRLQFVTGQTFVSDQVSRWTDTTYEGSTGRILGRVIDSQNGLPIPDLLISAGGMQAITSADGTYLLDGLAPGTHNLVVYAKDGAYQTFEQGATVAPEASTPAEVVLTAAIYVDVTFITTLPADTSPTALVRFAGSFFQLGNTFTDLSGGVSTLAARMPVMVTLPDGRRSLTLTLPVGADLHYKYTLGDGVWNAECNAQGDLNLRQIIIPDKSITIENQVAAWTLPGPAQIAFQVTPPAVLPSGDNLSIQFNPGYGWLEPIPMWPNADRTWSFTLYSPLQGMGSLQYRYCRNEQCGSADDASTAGLLATGRTVSLTDQAQTIHDTIQEWAWLPALSGPATVPNATIAARPANFLAGVALQAAYHPSWTPHFPQTIRYLQEMNANWLIFSPTWSYAQPGSPLLATDSHQDMPWHDLLIEVQQARQAGLNVGLYPQVHFSSDPEQYWQQAARDYPWWVSWFDRYSAFTLHHAQLAASSGAGVLILGGRDLFPAIPGGVLPDGSASGLPLDAENWWRSLLTELRSVYNGPIAWALPYPEGLKNPPPFLDLIDFVYVDWAAPLATDASASEADLVAQAGALLDASVLPFQQQTLKPVVLALGYASANGSLTGCLPVQEGRCLDARLLDRPNADYPQIAQSLDQQTAAYNAMLLAINDRPWIGGIISQGFYPPAMLQDKSASVYGKPAAGALWFWFSRFLNK